MSPCPAPPMQLHPQLQSLSPLLALHPPPPKTCFYEFKSLTNIRLSMKCDKHTPYEHKFTMSLILEDINIQ